MEITQEHLRKLKCLLDSVKRAKEGKALSREQEQLWAAIETNSQSFDSMAQAASAGGLSLEILKRAKRAGCPGFKGSRIQIAVVKKWVAHNESAMSQPSGDSLKDEKIREEVRKLRIKNDRDEGKTVLKTVVAAAILRIMSGAGPYLESKLVNELPSAMAGLDVPQGRVFGRRLCDQIMVYFQALAKEFSV